MEGEDLNLYSKNLDLFLKEASLDIFSIVSQTDEDVDMTDDVEELKQALAMSGAKADTRPRV